MMTSADQPPPPPTDQARFGRVNWIGLATLYTKEIKRFTKVATQTVLAPVVTTLLFLAIFSLAFGGSARIAWEVPFAQFLAPGLIMMAIAQNSFANTSSSLLIAKIQGNIVDVLMPPLSPAELVAGFTLAGVTRGAMVAVSVGVAMALFTTMTIHAAGWVIYFCLASSLMMALIGMITGLWAEKFDNLATITNFVVTPLAFLSGTFYSIDRLPESIQTIAHFNPFFYMIDGFRYGFLGLSDSPVWLGASVIGVVDIVLAATCLRLVARGYKLKT